MNFAAAVYADFACYLVQWQVDMVTMLEKAINYVQCLELQIRVRLLEEPHMNSSDWPKLVIHQTCLCMWYPLICKDADTQIANFFSCSDAEGWCIMAKGTWGASKYTPGASGVSRPRICSLARRGSAKQEERKKQTYQQRGPIGFPSSFIQQYWIGIFKKTSF